MGSMSSYADNDLLPWFNKEVTIATASTVTFHITSSGTDDATNYYLNKGQDGHGFVLRPSDNVEITSIQAGRTTYANGEILQGDPISVSTAGFSVVRRMPPFIKITIRTLVANTNVKLLVL